jgi:hypothetical protein
MSLRLTATDLNQHRPKLCIEFLGAPAVAASAPELRRVQLRVLFATDLAENGRQVREVRDVFHGQARLD